MNDQITETIIGCAMKIHSTLGHGFLESVYANALAHELGKSNINYQRETSINVIYDNTVIGEFKSDFKISDRLIIELKAIENLNKIHETQLVNCLKATRIDIGLLINFGSSRLQFKRKYRKPLSNSFTTPQNLQ